LIVSVTTFDPFRSELQALSRAVSSISQKTVRDDALRERFRMLFRVWISSVEPDLRMHLQSKRELVKMTAEIERMAQLASKYKATGDYRVRLRRVIQLADSLVMYLPPSNVRGRVNLDSHQELFLSSIPDLPRPLVPNPIFGWRSKLDAFVNKYPFDKSTFIMIRYRDRNATLIKAVKDALKEVGLFGVLASDHDLTDDLYNPIACLLCCSRGIAIFDEPEQQQVFNPNVAYELGMLHLLGRPCMILKHTSLKTLQTDILMKLYRPFTSAEDAAKFTIEWSKT
jgi:hypothetical protein